MKKISNVSPDRIRVCLCIQEDEGGKSGRVPIIPPSHQPPRASLSSRTGLLAAPRTHQASSCLSTLVSLLRKPRLFIAPLLNSDQTWQSSH